MKLERMCSSFESAQIWKCSKRVMNKDNEGEANTGQLGNYQIQLIGEEEVSTAVRRMKSGKAVVPDKGWTFISGPTFESVDDMRCEGGNRWKGTWRGGDMLGKEEE